MVNSKLDIIKEALSSIGDRDFRVIELKKRTLDISLHCAPTSNEIRQVLRRMPNIEIVSKKHGFVYRNNGGDIYADEEEAGKEEAESQA